MQIFKICPICGREFLLTSARDWVYKDEGEYLCSYSCLIKRRRAKVPSYPDFTKGALEKRLERNAKLIKLRRSGVSINRLCKIFNLSKTTVKDICRKAKAD